MIRRSAPSIQLEPLIARAFELWREIEAESGQNIMNLIGEVSLTRVQPDAEPERAAADELAESAGEADGALAFSEAHTDDIVDAAAETQRRRDRLVSVIERESAMIRERFGGQVEVLERADLRERFPGVRLFPDIVPTYEAEAGFLRPEVAIAAQRELAAQLGADLHDLEGVTGWQADGDGVMVKTSMGTYHAGQLILTPGPWAPELLVELGLPLEVLRIVNVYFQPQRTDWWAAENGAPDFLLNVEEGEFYGMPSIERLGVKIGRHDNGSPTTADGINREVSDAEIDALRQVLDKYLPGSIGRVLQTSTCMYTMTPDQQYVIDRHPQLPQLHYACGFSGTGFKFSCVVGEILAELALNGDTRIDIDFLAARRFAGPNS
jgi:sarcosine oxidase